MAQPTSAIPKKNLWRLQAKNIFLTWPQNTATKEDVLAKVQATWGDDLDWSVVAEEKHQDGTPHLHAVIAFCKKMYFKGKKGLELLDSITGKHGNYQSARSLKKTVTYVVKDDHYISFNLDVKTYIANAAAKKSTAIATMVLEDKTMEEICEEDPGFFMMHKRRIEDLSVWHERKKAKLQLKEWLPLELTDYQSESDLVIADWLNKNIGLDREFKAKQLYLCGPPDMGKTTLIMHLEKFCRIYYIPTDEDFCCHYDDCDWDLAIIDEFKGQKSITWLNRWLDGQTMPLKRKGVSSILKRKNIPTIILSNFPVISCYSKALEDRPTCCDSLLARLEVVDITSPIDVLY